MRDAAQNGGTLRELWLCAAAVQSVLGNAAHLNQIRSPPATDITAYAKASESKHRSHLPSILLDLVEALHLVAPAVWKEMVQDNVSGGADAVRLLGLALNILPVVVNLAATAIRKGGDEGAPFYVILVMPKMFTQLLDLNLVHHTLYAYIE